MTVWNKSLSLNFNKHKKLLLCAKNISFAVFCYLLKYRYK